MAYSYPRLQHMTLEMLFQSTDLQDPVLFLMTDCHMG